MEYRIKHSFYLDSQYSGPAGRIVDKEFYDKMCNAGYSENMEVTGVLPSFLKSDEQLDKELAELLAEKKKRENTPENMREKTVPTPQPL